MDIVYYIIETFKGKFKPFVAQAVLSPGDNDSSLFVVASGTRYETLEEAQSFLKENSPEGVIYLNPIKSSESGLSWLSEIVSVNSKETILE
jgi:hypothetical protein